MCTHGLPRMCVNVCEEARDQHWDSSFHCSPLYSFIYLFIFLRQGLSLSFQLTDWLARLTGELASGVCCLFTHVLFFTWVLGIWTTALLFVQKALHQLSHCSSLSHALWGCFVPAQSWADKLYWHFQAASMPGTNWLKLQGEGVSQFVRFQHSLCTKSWVRNICELLKCNSLGSWNTHQCKPIQKQTFVIQ